MLNKALWENFNFFFSGFFESAEKIFPLGVRRGARL